MNILVIDGQGGGIGRQIVQSVRAKMPDISITAVGTNSIAAAAMLKAGADRAATGENSVVVCCRDADVIIGPVAIVIADSLLGEITPVMAAAVARSEAKRILVPVNCCNNIIAGVPDLSVGRLVECVMDELHKLIAARNKNSPKCALRRALRTVSYLFFAILSTTRRTSPRHQVLRGFFSRHRHAPRSSSALILSMMTDRPFFI